MMIVTTITRSIIIVIITTGNDNSRSKLSKETMRIKMVTAVND